MTSSPLRNPGARVSTPTKSQTETLASAGAATDKTVEILPQFHHDSPTPDWVKMVEEFPSSTFRIVGRNGLGKSNLRHLPVKHAKDSPDFLPRIHDELIKQSNWVYKLCSGFTTPEVGIAKMVPMNREPDANHPLTWYDITFQDYMRIDGRTGVIQRGNVLPQAVDSASQYERFKVNHIQGLTTDGLKDILVIRQVINPEGFFALAVRATALIVVIGVYVLMKKAKY